MKIYRVTDRNGLFIRDDFTFTDDEIGLDVEPAQGFYLPKWNGREWVEGGTPPKVELVIEPTLEEKVADLQAQLDALIGWNTK